MEVRNNNDKPSPAHNAPNGHGAVSRAASPLRFVQVHTFYERYLSLLYGRTPTLAKRPFAAQIGALVDDGFSAVHMMAPYMGGLGYDAHLIIANCRPAQSAWFREHGLPPAGGRDWMHAAVRKQLDILKPDVLYLSNPVAFDSRFVRTLSHRPRLVFGWRAASIAAETDWSEFDIMLSSLPALRKAALQIGARHAEHFFPGYPAWINEHIQDVRPSCDVVFSGQWTAHQHKKRNACLRHIAQAALRKDRPFSCTYYLSGKLENLPAEVARCNRGARFGVDMHRALRGGCISIDARAEHQLSLAGGGALDIGGSHTANMRIFETTGSGVFLLTEYFDNLQDFFRIGEEIETFRDRRELVDKIHYYLAHPQEREEIARKGRERCLRDYSMQSRAQHLDRILRGCLAKKDGAEKPRATGTNLVSGQADSRGDKGHARVVGLQIEEGIRQMKGGKLEAAFAALSKAKSFRMPVRDLDHLRAVCLWQMNRHGEAREALKEELRYFPGNREALALLQQISSRQPQKKATPADTEFDGLLQTVRPYTMVGEKRLYSLFCLAKKICVDNVPGNFVECGVAAGGSSALLACVIKKYSRRKRVLFAFDSFEGMPAPTAEDIHAGVSAADTGWGAGTCSAPADSVRQLCDRLGVLDVVQTVKGYFQDTLPGMRQTVGKIGFLHMDGDWYESTKAILDNLYASVVPGGIIQVDDYGHWEGCRKALHEFETHSNITYALHRIDYSGVWLEKKPAPAANRTVTITSPDGSGPTAPGACINSRHRVRKTAKGPLRIVHLCSHDHGGAGKAAYRLHKGLQAQGVDSCMLVASRKSRDDSVKLLRDTAEPLAEKGLASRGEPHGIWDAQTERWETKLRDYPQRPQGLEIFTGADSVLDLSKVQEIKDADVVNLHWVAGIVNWHDAPQVFHGRPLVWTLHDMNAFTGGCHYAGNCEKYKTQCGACPQLGSGDHADLAHQSWAHKQRVYEKLDLHFVTPSKWLAQCAAESSLLKGFQIDVIPNGFPLDIFRPYAPDEGRALFNIPAHKKVILFGAGNVLNKRKGFSHLVAAFEQLARAEADSDYVLVCFGSCPRLDGMRGGREIYHIGAVDNEVVLAKIYSMADVVAIPSLEDNLPNIVAEAMACGTPVAGFDIGGIPDMIEHKKTGFLAEANNAASLADGIRWVITNAAKLALGRRSRERALQKFGRDTQALAYSMLYSSVLQANNRRKRTKCSFANDSGGDAELDNRHGERLFNDGNVAGAINAFCAAIEKNPHFALAFNNLGVALWSQGDSTKASEHIRRALELAPADITVIHNFNRIQSARNRIGKTCREGAGVVVLHPNNRQNTAAAGRVRQGRVPDPAEHAPVAGKPILVTGAHRSGSTWAGRIIAMAANVAYIDEPFNLNKGRCACGAKFDYWYQHVTPEDEGLYYRHLRHVIAENAARCAVQFPRPLVKDPIALMSAEWLARRFGMDVIVLIRHPAAFASSLKRLNWKYDFSHLLKQPLLISRHLQPFEDIIRRYATEQHDIIDQAALLWKILYFMVLQYQQRHPEWHFVRHEDLSREPIAQFQKLYVGLGLDFADRTRSAIIESTNPANPCDAPQGVQHFLKRNSAANSYSWSRKLGGAEVARIRRQVEDISCRFYSDDEWLPCGRAHDMSDAVRPGASAAP